MSVTAAQTIPGYTAGSWTIDPVHSEVGFAVRHMMVSKVRGKFKVFSGDIVTGESPLESSVTATIDLSSIDTGNEDRDNHLGSGCWLGEDVPARTDRRRTGRRSDRSWCRASGAWAELDTDR